MQVGAQTHTLEEWQAAIQITVDAVRSGALELPTGLARNTLLTTCRLPDGGAALLPGFPELPLGTELIATQQTFHLVSHIDALHEVVNTGNKDTVWAKLARRDMLENHPKELQSNYIKPVAVRLDSKMYKGVLVHGIPGRGKSVALNFAILHFIAKGAPVVVELAGDRVIYVPGGGAGAVGVYPAKGYRGGVPREVINAVYQPQTVYFYDPQQQPSHLVGVLQPIAKATCTVMPTMPNMKLYFSIHTYRLLKLHLYDLTWAEFAAVAGVLKPNMTKDVVDAHVAAYGTNLRCLAGEQQCREFTEQLAAAKEAFASDRLFSAGLNTDELFSERSLMHRFYGLCRPASMRGGTEGMYTARPYCNTEVSRKMHADLQRTYLAMCAVSKGDDIAPGGKYTLATILSDKL